MMLSTLAAVATILGPRLFDPRGACRPKQGTEDPLQDERDRLQQRLDFVAVVAVGDAEREAETRDCSPKSVVAIHFEIVLQQKDWETQLELLLMPLPQQEGSTRLHLVV